MVTRCGSNKLVAITDNPAATTLLMTETFKTLRAAGNLEVLLVSYAPGT